MRVKAWFWLVVLGLFLALPVIPMGQAPSSGGAFIPNTIIRIAGVWMNNKLLWNSTAPTISSGFGTGPSIASNNGNADFRVNVGTGGSASSGVIGLSAATAGWNCLAHPTVMATTGTQATFTLQTATSTTTATLTGYNTSGTATAWPSGTILIVHCAAY